MHIRKGMKDGGEGEDMRNYKRKKIRRKTIYRRR